MIHILRSLAGVAATIAVAAAVVVAAWGMANISPQILIAGATIAVAAFVVAAVQ